MSGTVCRPPWMDWSCTTQHQPHSTSHTTHCGSSGRHRGATLCLAGSVRPSEADDFQLTREMPSCFLSFYETLERRRESFVHSVGANASGSMSNKLTSRHAPPREDGHLMLVDLECREPWSCSCLVDSYNSSDSTTVSRVQTGLLAQTPRPRGLNLLIWQRAAAAPHVHCRS